MNQFKPTAAVYNLTKPHLSLSQSLLTQNFGTWNQWNQFALEAGGSLRLKFD